MNALKSATLWIVLFLVVILMFVQMTGKEQTAQLNLSQVLELADQNKLHGVVTDRDGKLEGKYVDPQS